MAMGRSYFCDYCLKGFPDNRTSRNRHLTGAQHKTKVREFYAECTEPLKLLESSQNEKAVLCKKFDKTGACDFGNGCRFSHFNPAYITKLKVAQKEDMESRSVGKWLQLLGERRKKETKVSKQGALITETLPWSMRQHPEGSWPQLQPLDWG